MGKYEDKSLAFETELGVDVFENVMVNRGRKDQAVVTGQDVAAGVFEVLCPLSGEREGQISPVDYEQGEQDGLVVNKLRFKCVIQKEDPDAYTTVWVDGQERKVLWKGAVTKSMVDAANLSAFDSVQIEFSPAVKSIGDNAFSGLSGLTEIYSFGGVGSIGQAAFRDTGLNATVQDFPKVETLMD